MAVELRYNVKVPGGAIDGEFNASNVARQLPLIRSWRKNGNMLTRL